MTRQQNFSDRHRLSSISTVAGILAHDIADLAPVVGAELSNWLQQVNLPSGWQIARFDADGLQPARIAVRGAAVDGRCDACETLSFFRFTGTPLHGAVLYAADLMLRNLGGAETITTYPLSVGAGSPAAAVRSSGFLNVTGQRIWLQVSTYLAGSKKPGAGLLIEHGIFVESACQVTLLDDIAELSDAVNQFFEKSSLAAAVGDESGSAPSGGSRLPTFRAGYFADFKWSDVVLIGADREGLRVFQSAVRSAYEEGAATFDMHQVKHFVVRQDHASAIEIKSQTVIWRFDAAKLQEIHEMVEGLIHAEHPAHNYFDYLISPAPTLMISVDEYVDGPPFTEYPEGMPVPPLS